MQRCCIEELTLAGCQPIEFFINSLFYLYKNIRNTRETSISGITRSAADSFV